jgi:hypothetical protein
MTGDIFPVGCAWAQMSKLGIFRPDQISETNFTPGRHRAEFTGEMVFPERDEVLNLHYKYQDVDSTYRRHLAQEARLGPGDRERGFGHKYRWNKERLQQDFDKCRENAVDIHGRDPHTEHPEPRWWR